MWVMYYVIRISSDHFSASLVPRPGRTSVLVSFPDQAGLQCQSRSQTRQDFSSSLVPRPGRTSVLSRSQTPPTLSRSGLINQIEFFRLVDTASPSNLQTGEGNKAKKFDFINQTVSRWEVLTGWA